MRCCLVLGDQLSDSLPSLANLNNDDFILLAEVHSEATYVKHHKQKLVLVFSAMRHFAKRLEEKGFKVLFVKLTDSDNTGDLVSEMRRHQEKYSFSEWVVTEPGEWRLKHLFFTLSATFPVPVKILEDTRFIVSHREFNDFLQRRNVVRMEHFYRKVRQSTGILMDNGKPCGGRWNFDPDNRKSYSGHELPEPPRWQADAITDEVIHMVEEKFFDHFGSLNDFFWPVTTEQAQQLLEHFIRECLPSFGDFQDAMVLGEDTLFHSLLSASLNIGLLDPLTVCLAAEEAYRGGHAPINAVEGFVRQIIGWREFVRGLYWAHMPRYSEHNYLEAHLPLPAFFWDEELTDMVCLKEAIRNTREHAYAHHIQRLMVTGNFALLAGCNVQQVCEWYLSVYADAFEWVELPNTLGMALYADGGIMASKPYCASGKYIDRMSDYCKSCRYDVSSNDTDDACPFNFLYWDFLIRHQEKFNGNPRMLMILKNVLRMTDEKVDAITANATRFRENIMSDDPALSKLYRRDIHGE